MCTANEKRWDDTPIQFRDPVYGYISVPKIYVEALVDTVYMQRLKNVAQSGIRALFSAATHDRFSHSLGVFKFARLAYASLKINFVKSIKDRKKEFEADLALVGKLDQLEHELDVWETYLSIAALLHDIGHPVGSHAFEFLYDDIYLALSDVPSRVIDLTSAQNWQHELQRVKERNAEFRRSTLSYSNSFFMRTLKPQILEEAEINTKKLEGNPHERMSAYLILNENPLLQAIHSVVKSRWKFLNPESNQPEADTLNDSVRFICRMITGQEYHCAYTPTFDFDNYVNSMRNCVIHVLNGVLDADSMDYIMRNSYSAGYATHKIDYDRLCSAFTVAESQNKLELCFAKSSLSVIEGFVTARHFEPKWLYSHHKVVYHDVLLKSLFHYAVKYLCYLDCKRFAGEIPNESSARDQYAESIITGEQARDNSTQSFLPSDWVYAYYTYILAPWITFKNANGAFHATVDADLDALFKSIHLELKSTNEVLDNNLAFHQRDKALFLLLLQEFEQRQFKKSLWKSHAEYQLFLKKIADGLGLPKETIHDYLMDLIQNGIELRNFGLLPKTEGVEESKLTFEQIKKHFPETYQEQYFFRPYSPDNMQSVDPQLITKEPLKYFAIQNAQDVFGHFHDEYDFSHQHCVCKIYKAKFKDFSKIKILFKDKSYKATEVIDIPPEKPIEFPYIFYTSNADTYENRDAESVLRNFTNRFQNYCARKLEREQWARKERSMSSQIAMQHIIRDVVHGDISFSDPYWEILNTKEFQRLRRIKQLATASQVFPNAEHTRFAHSIGTYHIMKMIIEHFQQIFSTLFTDDFFPEDAPIALLAALLHDLGHGPYSHAFETVAPNAIGHEEWTKNIILDKDTEVNKKIIENFGADAPEKVVACIMHDTLPCSSNQLNFSMIYSGLVSGPLDADRMDYLLRDAYNTATHFGSIDVQRLISSMRIAQINGQYCVCFEENHLSSIEQLVFSRYEMYDNVYFDEYKVLSETLVQCILQRAYQKRDLLLSEDRSFLEMLFDGNMTVAEFLLLEDHTISYYFQQWMNDARDTVLKEMCHSLIERRGYVAKHVAGDSAFNFSQLLRIAEKICGMQEHDLSKNDPREFFGLIKVDRNTSAYPDDSKPTDVSKSIWIMKSNGVVIDFRKATRLHNPSDVHFWRIQRNYVFYNKAVLMMELLDLHCNEPNAQATIDLMIDRLEREMKSLMPRHHIEIEEKYLCDQEVLEEAEGILVSGDETLTPYKLQGSFLEVIQEDEYYDTKEMLLSEKKCSLRIRKIGNEYTCTVKLPVNSENFGGSSQFARFEYEMTAPSKDLIGFASFINSHLRPDDEPLFSEALTETNISAYLIPIVVIENRRKKAVVTRNTEKDSFQCEICLDDVTYKKGTKTKKDYQIEIELKSDYLHHVVLKVFTNKLEELLDGRLKREEKSKYMRGLELIEPKVH